jgi:GNAT superfamily N-acetyltransferase
MHAATLRRVTTLDSPLLDGLAALTLDCVDGGASIGFMHPLSPAQARAFWQHVAVGLHRGERALLVAEDDTGVVGTVQLIVGQPDNQAHRADLAKLQVHRRARRRGLAEALMRAAEALARDCGKTLLVLDTVTGSDADRLYTRLGWQRVGEIPDYALWPHGGPCPTTIFYKRVAGTDATLKAQGSVAGPESGHPR